MQLLNSNVVKDIIWCHIKMKTLFIQQKIQLDVQQVQQLNAKQFLLYPLVKSDLLIDCIILHYCICLPLF